MKEFSELGKCKVSPQRARNRITYDFSIFPLILYICKDKYACAISE